MDNQAYSERIRPTMRTVDWWIVICYLLLVFFGWINIYASAQGLETSSIFDLEYRSGKQFIWIVSALGLAAVVLFIIPPRIYDPVAPFLYAISAVLLLAVIFVGRSINGSHSWFTLGPISFQPAETSKITTALLLASYMSRGSYRMKGRKLWITLGIILIPMAIIVAEKETGSALVYAGFIFMLYREGLTGWIIALAGLAILLFILTVTMSSFASLFVLLCIVTFFDVALSDSSKWWFAIIVLALGGLLFFPEDYRTTAALIVMAVYSVWSAWKAFRNRHNRFRWFTLMVMAAGVLLTFSTRFIMDNVMKEYQKERIETLLGMKDDLAGVGYNVHQSKIAIGSGGMWGKGFCNGTQTAYGFVPEQSTDFIFCTVGEEWGFAGCLAVIAVYFILIWRIITDSEHSRNAFSRIFGYCLASCLFMHLFINVGMTIGLVPVIGIPLPFMSYGGSSLWAFTIMLFIFVRLDTNEKKYF